MTFLTYKRQSGRAPDILSHKYCLYSIIGVVAFDSLHPSED